MSLVSSAGLIPNAGNSEGTTPRGTLTISDAPSAGWGRRRQGRGGDESRVEEGKTGSDVCGTSWLVLMATGMAALGGVLFGYDIGIISGALLQLKKDFQLTCQQSEIVVSALLIGAVIASVCGGFLVDYCGRKATIIVNDILFVIGEAMLTAATSYPLLVSGRLIVGFAVSLSATAECVYISEISPASKRGFLVSLNELGITIGFLLAYILNYAFISLPNGWRYMFGFSILLAIFQGIGMLFLPKSPRYLTLKGQELEAKVVLRRLLGEDEAEREFERIAASISETRSHTARELCQGSDSMLARFLISLALVVMQQFSGQPTVLLYAPTIFQQLGFESNISAALATVGLGCVKVAFTIVFLLVADKAGRRTLLVAGTAIMTVAILALGIIGETVFDPQLTTGLCHNSPVDANSSSVHTTQFNSDFNVTLLPETFPTQTTVLFPGDFNSTLSTVSNASVESIIGSWLALVALLAFVAGYQIGFGPGTWLVLSEIFPTSVRGRAISIATTFNWASNLIVSITFLDLISAVGVSRTFLGYSVVCAISVLFIFFALPETKGRTLEEITTQLKHRQGLSTLKTCCCPASTADPDDRSTSAFDSRYQRVDFPD